MKIKHCVQIAAALFLALVFGQGAKADTYLITITNGSLCTDPGGNCVDTINGSFDYSATGTPGSSGPATNINLSTSGTLNATFDTFEAGEQFPSPNGSSIFFTDAAGDELTISLPFLPALSGQIFEATTLGCAAGSQCFTDFGSGGLINFGQGAGGTFTAVDLGSGGGNPNNPTPEPSTFALFAVALIALAGAAKFKLLSRRGVSLPETGALTA